MYDKRPKNATPDRILSYVQECQYSPSLREIAKAVGVKSPSTVMLHLRELERQGLVGFAGQSKRVYVKDAA